jgi:integrase
MAMALEPQRTLPLQPDASSDSNHPSPAVKKSRPCPYKGVPVGAKWELTEEDTIALLQVMPNSRDKIMVRLGAYLGLRISELLSLQMSDVTDVQGRILEIITIPSVRLKGGKDTPPKVYERPEGHVRRCACRECKLFRQEIVPKPRRKPDDVQKWLSPEAQALVRTLLERLAKTCTGLEDRSRYLFESRKRAQDGRSRPVSRQQAWYVIKQAARTAQLQYLSRVGTHSLRKSFAMNILGQGGSMRDVMIGLGHRSQATSEHYCRHDSKQAFEAQRELAMKNSKYLSIGVAA